MSEEKHKSRAWIWWAAIAVLALYPLSIGPAMLLAEYLGGAPLVLAVYSPILATIRRCRPIGEIVLWYLKLWGVF